MTLLQLIKAIELTAMHQPSVNMIVENDVFRLNEKADAKYGVFAFVQGQHTSAIESSFINYGFTFFYVDRLKNDLSNQLEVQSVGIETLDNILRQLEEKGIFVESQYTFQVFNQRFLDECAGVFCNITLSVPVGSVCPESFGDFNDDFNDDFYIY